MQGRFAGTQIAAVTMQTAPRAGPILNAESDLRADAMAIASLSFKPNGEPAARLALVQVKTRRTVIVRNNQVKVMIEVQVPGGDPSTRERREFAPNVAGSQEFKPVP